MNQKIFIVGAKRSPIGSFLGSFKDLTPVDLGVQVLQQLLTETHVPVDKIDEVIIGNVLSAGVGQGIGRQIAIKSGVPIEVPAYSVNMVCGSGMKAVMNAVAAINAKMANIIVAGGVESMSQAPFLVPGKVRDGFKMGDMNVIDDILVDSLVDAFSKTHMGITAENIAEKYSITRAEQDEFALSSQAKAIAAVDSGRFADEIVPITVKNRKETIIVSHDEYPNRTTSSEKMAKLRPAFKNDGSVTAGNASGINDGASFTIIASEAAVIQYQLPVIAEIIAVGQGGVDPNYMGLGPVPAIRNVLNNADMKLSDMQLIELNEAFASQSLGVIHELIEEHKICRDDLLAITNVNGGAIALGHPVGMSGNRIIVTLLYEMIHRNVTYGLASLCIGGGMGTAVIIKRV
ncbi:MAG: acetyl-CoA C-acetyltransferase [Candidatus Izemoplasmatales bacterium]|jgi:acetyl-CoA C-acetyltransferase|nr:acetyl-CoA C-acetyltransferase [Candidatus Izemoplasmatales bacterium]